MNNEINKYYDATDKEKEEITMRTTIHLLTCIIE